jgi:hypothetical protein
MVVVSIPNSEEHGGNVYNGLGRRIRRPLTDARRYTKPRPYQAMRCLYLLITVPGIWVLAHLMLGVFSRCSVRIYGGSGGAFCVAPYYCTFGSPIHEYKKPTLHPSLYISIMQVLPFPSRHLISWGKRRARQGTSPVLLCLHW